MTNYQYATKNLLHNSLRLCEAIGYPSTMNNQSDRPNVLPDLKIKGIHVEFNGKENRFIMAWGINALDEYYYIYSMLVCRNFIPQWEKFKGSEDTLFAHFKHIINALY